MKLSKSLFIAAVMTITLIVTVQAAGPTGAIFTTTPDGTIVNENVRYNEKIEVYLDGGPGPNAPQTAAGLDNGMYVFQVTDPSGKYLLSEDPAMCRVVEVKDGVIFREVPATELGFVEDSYTVGKKTFPCRVLDGNPAEGVAGPSGRHDWNYDADHGPYAIVVQLMPFGDTPNPGGVYKAWMEKLGTYLDKGGELGNIPTKLNGASKKECPDFCAERDPGFGPPNTDTKTDNFKVKKPGKPPIPPEITVRKFHDKNFNGIWDPDEEEVTGWAVDYTDPLNITTTVFTPKTILSEPPGLYTFLEDTPEGTLQTVGILDGAIQSLYPTANATVLVNVLGTSGETHEVIYGNVGLGKVTACKVYDRHDLGRPDADEPFIPGWKMVLSGTLANGASYGPIEQVTEENGCTTFNGLMPGDYTLTEIIPATGTWFASGPTSVDFTLISKIDGSVIKGGWYTHKFTNYCVGKADFGTKGYWHNKNGLMEVTEADRDYVNGLDPYDAPSTYFGAGDEPFDGLFQNGNPVAAAFNNDDNSLIWGAGTWQAEISLFLVDANAGGDPREQLAQQLLAFIFNVRHRLEDPGTIFWYGGVDYNAQDIIEDAVYIWGYGTPTEQNSMQELLNDFNESDSLPFIHYDPCLVCYP